MCFKYSIFASFFFLSRPHLALLHCSFSQFRLCRSCKPITRMQRCKYVDVGAATNVVYSCQQHPTNGAIKKGMKKKMN